MGRRNVSYATAGPSSGIFYPRRETSVGTHSPPEITALNTYQKLARLDTPIVGTDLLLGHASCGAGVAPSLGGRFTSMLINERTDYPI